MDVCLAISSTPAKRRFRAFPRKLIPVLLCLHYCQNFLGWVLFSLMSVLEAKYVAILVEDLSPFTCWKKAIAMSNLLSVNKITFSPHPWGSAVWVGDNSCYCSLNFLKFVPAFLEIKLMPSIGCRSRKAFQHPASHHSASSFFSSHLSQIIHPVRCLVCISTKQFISKSIFPTPASLSFLWCFCSKL